MAKKIVSIAMYCCIGLLTAGLVLLVARPPHGSPILILPTHTPAGLTIYITGEVIHPGVYTLEPGSRVEAAITAAGGLTSKAAVSSINLAELLHDEQSIHVSSIDESRSANSPSVAQEGIIDPDGLIDINTATSEQLQTLPGIGPTKAEAIIEFRNANGQFQTVNDLLLVPGIGEVTLSQIADYITINP